MCAFSKQLSSRAHVMSRTVLDHASFSLQHNTPTSLLLCSTLRTGQILVHCNQDSCLAVLPFRVCSQVMTPTPLSRKAVQRLRQRSYPVKSQHSTHNSGEDIVTAPAVSEVDGRSDLGMVASPLSTPEREMCDFSQIFLLK